MNTIDIDFEAWIDLTSDDLPDLDHLRKLVEIIESLMCGGGFGCIIIFVLSEGARRYPFG